jgi:hypothetical protein
MFCDVAIWELYKEDTTQGERTAWTDSGLVNGIYTRVHMKNGVFWDVTLCCSCKNRSFGGI